MAVHICGECEARISHDEVHVCDREGAPAEPNPWWPMRREAMQAQYDRDQELLAEAKAEQKARDEAAAKVERTAGVSPGWLCPRCDTVHAPHVDLCGICMKGGD